MTPEKLKQLRESEGLTQEQFARELKVGTSTLRMWENCKGFTTRQNDNIELRVNAWQLKGE